MEVQESPISTFTFNAGAQRRVDDSADPLYGGDYVNGAVVPFSWEEKPGVPLLLSPNNNHLDHIKVSTREACDFGFYAQREVILNPFSIDNTMEECKKHEEKASTPAAPSLLLQSSVQLSPNHMLFPLPKPPSASASPGLQNSTSIMSNTSSNASSHPSNPSNINQLSTPPSLLSYSSAKKHTHSRQKFSSYLSKEPDKGTSIFYMTSKANYINDDPFLKAIQACTEAKVKSRQENHKSTYIALVQNDGCVPRRGGIKEADQEGNYNRKSKYISTEAKIIKARESNYQKAGNNLYVAMVEKEKNGAIKGGEDQEGMKDSNKKYSRTRDDIMAMVEKGNNKEGGMNERSKEYSRSSSSSRTKENSSSNSSTSKENSSSNSSRSTKENRSNSGSNSSASKENSSNSSTSKENSNSNSKGNSSGNTFICGTTRVDAVTIKLSSSKVAASLISKIVNDDDDKVIPTIATAVSSKLFLESDQGPAGKTAACNLMSYQGHAPATPAAPPPAANKQQIKPINTSLSKPHTQPRPPPQYRYIHRRSSSYGGCLGCSNADSIVRI